MSVMEIPTMSKGSFLRREESIGKLWKVALLKEMTEAGEEEKRLAEAAGDFREDGSTPWITVIVDGEHGKQHECVALQLYATEKGTVVHPCGLFADLKDGYLAASPDGLVGTDRIVEVKCPLKYKEQEPLEAARNFSEKKRRNGAPVLSRSHSYFYQVHGQLHITRRIICDFVVYNTKGIHVQEVRRDDAFWTTKMEPFLLRFYKDCVLPGIVDSRLARSMAVRCPEWNRLAIEDKEKSKNGEALKAKRAKYKKD
ncbi:hypothetical protein MTO96_027534 [Rhipicephalus appendiculatus]